MSKVAERLLDFLYDVNTFRDAVTLCEVSWIIIGKPYVPRFIFPDEGFLGEVDRNALAALHQRCTDFRIAKDQ